MKYSIKTSQMLKFLIRAVTLLGRPASRNAIMRSRVRLYILLASIWFVISLPLPWLIGNEAVSDASLYTILGIVGIMSIPFVMLGIVWSARPELAS